MSYQTRLGYAELLDSFGILAEGRVGPEPSQLAG